MSRESLGSFRLHRFTCDVCAVQVENRSKGNGPIPLPPGWMHVAVDVEREDGRSKRVDGDVCSANCAGKFTQDAMQQAEPS